MSTPETPQGLWTSVFGGAEPEARQRRYAIYFTPPREDPLAAAAASWLGRDAFTGRSVEGPGHDPADGAAISFHTAAARRYGFHATLKAPFSLADGATEADLLTAYDQFCSEREPFVLPRLEIGQIEGFFALLPGEPCIGLSRLAADAVMHFEPFRAPLSQIEMERRTAMRLSPAEMRYLQLWGYPHVFDAFRFHMTLTGRMSGPEATRIRDALDRHFAPHLQGPVEIGTLAVFVEPEKGSPFEVLSLRRLGCDIERRTARNG